MSMWLAAIIPAGLSLVFFLKKGFATSGFACAQLAISVALLILFTTIKDTHPIISIIGLIAVGALLFIALCLIVQVGATIVADSYGTPNVDADYIIVLGAAVYGSSPSTSLTERIDATAAYMYTHPNSIAVVSGGRKPKEDFTEAFVMSRELQARGIPQSRILCEGRATSTFQNIQFSLALIKPVHTKVIAVCTSEYHLHRALLIMKDAGIKNRAGIPALTAFTALKWNYILRECSAVLHYKLRH